MLLQPNLHPELLAGLVAGYSPSWIASRKSELDLDGYRKETFNENLTIHVAEQEADDAAPHDELALLLSTSGSTGSRKLVRLSADALDSNAASISEYLRLCAQDRAVTTLPLAYSFGMSVLNSHLHVGGSIVLTEKTVVSRDFWELAAHTSITSLSGVPNLV